MSDENENGREDRVPDPAAILRQTYGDRRGMIDVTIPPVLFVTANTFTSLTVAAAVAATYGVGTAIYRIARKHQARQALFGLLGLGFALGLALRTGRASSYFLPNVIGGFVLASAALISVALRKPASAFLARALAPDRPERPGARNAHMIVTAAWGTWFLVRSTVRTVLIVQDRPEALGVTAIALGAPATVALLAATFAFLRWRLGETQGEG
jgi:hypothetical protein